MQYATPQFIESEGKIISFLTFRQFFTLIGGGIVCGLFFMVLPFYFFAIGSIVAMGLAAAIAFVKVDNMSLVTMAMNFIGFTMASKNYMWKKKESPYPFKVQKKEIMATPEDAQMPAPAKMQPSKLNDIRKMIETKR